MAERIGRVPPNNKDAETALLGAVLLRNRALEEVQNLLVKEDFYMRSNQNIWDGLLKLRNEKPGVTIDILTLTDFLSEKGTLDLCGGMAYIASLTDSVPASVNASYYAQIIKNCSLKRQLLELSVVIGDSAFDNTQDVKQSIDQIDEKLTALSTDAGAAGYVSSGKLLYQVLDNIHDMMSGKVKSALKSGFNTLDTYLGGGFKPTDLIIIGARPSVGKSAFALSIAHNMAFRSADPVKIGFFSLEMSGMAIMERLISRETSINSMRLRDAKYLDRETDNELMRAADRMYDYSDNLLIQDTPNIKLMEIKAQSRRMVRDEGVKLIFIDYIGLIELEGAGTKQRYEQISEISRSLKSLARELKVPVICLSQVNREAGKDRPPMLADLRESGSIEQDADVVILLDDATKRLNDKNRIEQYESEEAPDPDDRNLVSKNNRKIKVIIAKQRNGSTGAFDMLFRSNFVSFTEIDKRADF